MVEDDSQMEAGFTLVEMLVALALSAIILAFAVSGLSLSMYAFSSISQRQNSAAQDIVMQRLRGLLVAAFPASSISPQDGLARLFFDGRQMVLEFVTISSGSALEGGLIRVRITLNCAQSEKADCRLSIENAVHRMTTHEVPYREPVFALSGLSGMRIRYFGRRLADAQPAWFDDWRQQDHLPQAIAIHFISRGTGDPHDDLLVQIHNASS